MGCNSTFAARDERVRGAALRDGVLQCGRRLGWPSRIAITFIEQLARRPWKRCTPEQLAAVLDELHTIQWALEVCKTGPVTAMLAPALLTVPRGDRHALGH